MKTKFPKSFACLIISVVLITGMFVSVHADNDTTVPSGIYSTSSDYSTDYNVTESEPESSSNDIFYTPDFEADYAELTLYELFDLLEYSLGLDENETVENGGDVAAVMSVAMEIKTALSYVRESENYIYLLTRLEEAFVRNGVTPSERTARIIEAIKAKIRDMYAEEPSTTDTAPTTQHETEKSPCCLSKICDYLKQLLVSFIVSIINTLSAVC